jgi:putative ABC transport system permease protein
MAALLSRLPPVAGLPLFGYLAVSLLLVGGIMLMPRLSASLFGLAYRRLNGKGASRRPIAGLALARLAHAPNQASIALSGVVSSFSLMVAMAIMVASFRISVDEWLGQILPAPLFVRTVASGDTGRLTPQQQKQLAAAHGVADIRFLRVSSLLLSPDRPPVALLARDLDSADGLDPGKSSPILPGNISISTLPAGATPVWVSEAMVDLYGYTVGKQVELPLSRQQQPIRVPVVVAGIWRDYARQSGSIMMRLSDYQRLTGDLDVSDAAVKLDPGVNTEQIITEWRHLPFGAALEFAQAGEIRAISLKIFDRSFAITYLLELVAMVIGLFGVAASFSAQTLARAKEFGMLRHLGVRKREILAGLTAEGGLLAAIGIGVGFTLGWLISLILVFVINPQSFHWSMQMHIPWPLLASVAALMLAAATLTALLAGRQATAGSALLAVREDW